MQCFSADESSEITTSTTEAQQILKDAYAKVKKALAIAKHTQ